ncbi:DUF6173 family protein [Antarcticimicrobium luteum]|uniref:Uncharacterized protein n=1 Tax=Antarcticimicrobium luteum TaxID=2547397 RepID=A0A4R5UWS5_9RHOB|nr:DUF6173 family protein [Antarcticimicrobium luteum]TDK43754.1 hypothetical protein E1832_15870 [Antarcticimicrobium luteum]
MDGKISTAAEAAEGDAIPHVHEVHADPKSEPCLDGLRAGATRPVAGKSPARWAYERIILYIRNFEDQLDNSHEVAMGFTGGDAGVVRIEGIGYFDPDIVTFYGSDSTGARTQLIQHVSQLNVMLRALPKPQPDRPPARIGFRLAVDLDQD